MPGCLAWEEDTRRSGRLVAESEPEYDAIPGLTDMQPRFPPAVLVLSYMQVASWGASGAQAGAQAGLHAESVLHRRDAAIRRRGAGEVKGDGQAPAGGLVQLCRTAVGDGQPVHDGQ